MSIAPRLHNAISRPPARPRWNLGLGIWHCSLAVLLATAGLAGADEPFVRVTGVPERLVFPLPPGANAVATAAVGGAAARSVWLAADRDAKARVQLDKVGPGEYQINLADPDVAAVLTAPGHRGRFQIFVETDGGQTLSSLAFNYGTFDGKDLSDLCHLALVNRAGEQRPLADPPRHAWERRDDWLDTEATAAIEIRFDETPTELAVRARAGDAEWPFAAGGGPGAFRLDVADAVRAGWSAAGELAIQYRAPAGSWRHVRTLRAKPRELKLDGSLASVTIHQRAGEDVPGSRGYLRVRLGDITAGQVMLGVEAADGTEIVPRRAVRQGDAVPLPLGERQYVLYVRRLVNVLVGDDWAELEVSAMPGDELARIARLLAAIETSDVTFLREGETHTGREAAAHLRRKLAAAGPKVKTCGEFIEKIASRSSTTGAAYRIRLADGSESDAAEWLTARSAALDREAAKAIEDKTRAE